MRIASGWPFPGAAHLFGPFDLGDCTSLNQARLDVALGRRRWLYASNGLLKLVPFNAVARPTDHEISESPWTDFPDYDPT